MYLTLCEAQSCISFVYKGGSLSDRVALITERAVSIPSVFFCGYKSADDSEGLQLCMQNTYGTPFYYKPVTKHSRCFPTVCSFTVLFFFFGQSRDDAKKKTPNFLQGRFSVSKFLNLVTVAQCGPPFVTRKPFHL